MIERWFEAFTQLEKLSAPDGLGGETGGFRPGTPFRAVLTMVPGKEFPMGGQPVLMENPVLLHDFDVTLQPGDLVRREQSGAVYRVTGCSDLMRSSPWSGLNFAQAPVERVVLP